MNHSNNSMIRKVTGGGKRGLKREAGLTLAESMLVLGIGVTLAAIAFGTYSLIQSTIKPSSVGEDTSILIDKVKQVFGQGGDFTVVTPLNLSKTLQFPFKSFKWDSSASAVVDAFGNTVTFDGSTTKFSILLGPYDQDACAQIVPMAAAYAYKVNVGSAAALTGSNAGSINTSVGTAYKSGATITPAAVATGCNGGNAKIAIEIR